MTENNAANQKQNNNAATVLVRKSDGTMVRMSLVELEAMKKNISASKQPIAQKNDSPTPVSPKTEVKMPEKVVVKPVEQSAAKPVLNVKPQFKSIVKDPFLKNNVPDAVKWDKNDHVSLLHPSAQNDLPAKISTQTVATIAPVKKVFTNEAAYRVSDLGKASSEENKSLDSLIRQNAAAGRAENILLTPKSVAKNPVLSDVTAPASAKLTVGPVDEIRNFTLTDFRRLGPTVTQAVPVFLAKFKTLANESYLTYIEAIEAWKKSPLYTSFVKLVVKGLAEKKTLLEILRGSDPKTNLKIDEVEAIVEINSKLN